jgi:predicted dehydrogenase
MIAHIRRYKPAFELAKKLYTDGTVGKPVMCIAGIEGWDLSEWGSHWLDMFRFFHNDAPVKWVFGQARVREQRGYGHAMEEHAIAYFEFEGGGKGFVDGGAKIGDATMTLIGTSGTIRIYGEDELHIDTAQGRRVEKFTDKMSTDWQAIWGAAISDLVQWLDGGPEPRIGFSHTAASAELNLAAYVSAIRGDRIDLPLVPGACDDIDAFPIDVLKRTRPHS